MYLEFFPPSGRGYRSIYVFLIACLLRAQKVRVLKQFHSENVTIWSSRCLSGLDAANC